jgi:hypothetical protein
VRSGARLEEEFCSLIGGTEERNEVNSDKADGFPAFIQGDSGGICSTLGNDSMCDSKQKSSYEHVSDFERLPRL